MGIKFDDEIQGLWLLGTLPILGRLLGILVQLCTGWQERSQSRGPGNRENQRGTSNSGKGKYVNVECYYCGLSRSFWGEALNTEVHVINLTPCVPLKFNVPNRVWSGKDVSYSHLRVFGCKVFVHIPKDERSNLDVKSKLCAFLGYGDDEFGYRLYDPDVEKRETIPQHSDNLIDLGPVPLQHIDTHVGDDVPIDDHGSNDVDAQE
ncbi:uncharacterized protein LOC124931344 [Impatiens glandulifera]|uniref:uncharacterized protein LOC124931344 n=1 Tax=Impatiens glandulifera TaxID=253017 RepID=UPI001FB131BE|nr:uncharacterized protein LOC124931344 [Impatiens glandulifera]